MGFNGLGLNNVLYVAVLLAGLTYEPESALHSFWFQVASLPMGDYPYAPADSRRLSVIVGGPPQR